MAISGPPQGGVKTPVVRVAHPANKPGDANGAAAPAAGGAVRSSKAGTAHGRPGPGGLGAKKNLIIAGGAGMSLLVIAVALLVWKPWKTEPPRMNDEPYKIAKFVASADFKSLPFDRQFTYMEKLDEKEDAVAQAYTDNKLSDEEYARSRQFAYLGKHLKRAKNYSEKVTPSAQRAYIDKQLEKKKKNNASDKSGKSIGAEPADADDVKRDDSEEQSTISGWPADAQAQWSSYRAALKARKDQRKEEEEKQKAAATQQAATPPKTADATGAK